MLKFRNLEIRKFRDSKFQKFCSLERENLAISNVNTNIFEFLNTVDDYNLKF